MHYLTEEHTNRTTSVSHLSGFWGITENNGENLHSSDKYSQCLNEMPAFSKMLPANNLLIQVISLLNELY